MDREGAPAPEGSPAGEEDGAAERHDAPTGSGGPGLEGIPTPEDLAAVAEEGRTVEAAAQTPAAGAVRPPEQKTDRAFLWGVLGLVLLLVLGWLGGTAVWQLRRDLRSLEGRLAGAQAHTARVETLQARAALLRVRADLEALRQTLPPELAAEVERADAILGGVAGQLSPQP